MRIFKRSREWANLRVRSEDLKAIRETLCTAQGRMRLTLVDTDEALDHHSARLQALINEIERHRPTANNGKHGNLHTSTCGCEDK